MLTGSEYLRIVYGGLVLIYSLVTIYKLFRDKKGYFTNRFVDMPNEESVDKIPVQLSKQAKREVALDTLKYPVVLFAFVNSLILANFAVYGPYMWVGFLLSGTYLFYAVWITKSTFKLGGKLEFPVWVRIIGIVRNVISIPYMAYWLWEMIIKRFVS